MSKRVQIKSVMFSLVALLVSILLMIVFTEILLRSLGRNPWRFRDFSKESLILEPDPVLGWKNKPGIYTKWHVDNVKVTIWPDGSRATQPQRQKKDKQIVIVGGSFTFGWAISDNQTFAWKLQQEFPSIEFLNYGTGGYGTYQSLLILEKVFAGQSTPPAMVLYAFCDFHEGRNVATSQWLINLRKSSKRGHVYLPYCTLDRNKKLVRHLPEAYPFWPLEKSLFTVNFLHEHYMTLKTRRRIKQKSEVTKKLLLEMNNLCKKNKSQLVVLLIQCNEDSKSKYKKFLLENNMDYIVCTDFDISSSEAMVHNDGHPSETVNSFWMSRIEDFIRTEVYPSERANNAL